MDPGSIVRELSYLDEYDLKEYFNTAVGAGDSV